MKSLLLVSVILMTSLAAFADEHVPTGPGGGTVGSSSFSGCWERSYSAAELQRNAGQKVASLVLLISQDGQGNENHVLLAVDRKGHEYKISSADVENLSSNPTGIFEPSRTNLIKINSSSSFYETVSKDGSVMLVEIQGLGVLMTPTDISASTPPLALKPGSLDGVYKLKPVTCD